MKNSEYGTRIINLEAGSLYEYNLGVRERYEYKRAMLTNSLLHDFLINNGLKVKDGVTRDIVCIDFSYGSKSYEEDLKKLKNLSKKAKQEGDKEKRIRLIQLRKKALKNKYNYVKKTKEEIREEYYQNGVDIKYITYNKKGEVKKEEIIHYKMLFRSTGKAKKGSCMFIRDKLYIKAYKFLTMGIKVPKNNAPIVELSAYMPLVASTIVGKISINPKNILILNDVDRFFETKAVLIETDENKHCYAQEVNSYKIKNTLFDGQALIDSSIFPNWGDGYILLRQHFCKMAAFNTNIQLFFKDYFKDNYESAKVIDMFGNEHYAKDIKLITTDNAMKWLKFNVSYDYWCKKVLENGAEFGIVKTAHESKLGNVQRMSYQMVNSLDINTMSNIIDSSKTYIEDMKRDNNVFLDYLEKNKNFSNDYEVLIALCNHNKEFTRSEYFRDRKRKIIESYVLNFRSGRVIQNADNLTIVGSPYAMLLHSVGESVDKDNTFNVEQGTIQCYTKRFRNDEYLAEFRSPFNSRNNLGYLHNVYTKNMERYFNLGKLCIAINMNGTDFQEKNNGSDQDSDSIYVTNQPQIVSHAKYCYETYPTIVNNIPKEKNSYNNTPLDYAIIDNNLAKSQRTIGESSNLAQLALTYTYNFKDKKYSDYVCILSVIAQASIDSAKRRFDIDIPNEIDRIKKDMCIKDGGYPKFWLNIRKDFNKNKINYNLECPMNYLTNVKFKEFRSSYSRMPMSDFFIKHELDENRRKCKKVEDIIQKYSLKLYNNHTNTDEEEYLLLRNDFDKLIEDIKVLYISNNYSGLMSWLIDRAFCISPQLKSNRGKMKSTQNQNKAILMRILYGINPKVFMEQWKKYQ